MIAMRSPAPKNVSRVVVKNSSPRPPAAAAKSPKSEAKILFSRFFQSVGPRSYHSELKELPNGNHLLVLTEKKRDPETGEAKQLRLFVFGEDFSTFFRMLHETAQFMRENPIPPEVRRRRTEFWTKKKKQS
jgi:hypothetical protein